MDSTSSHTIPPFKPPAHLRDPWVQTLAAQIPALRGPKFTSSLERVRLADGDELVVSRSVPSSRSRGGVILLHGLCGSQESLYIRRSAQHLQACGYTVIRVNMRGAGPGLGHARRPYHSGLTEDLDAVVAYLHAQDPSLAWVLTGFSLGGNVVLKLAGEYGTKPPTCVRAAIAVCPPIELAATSEKLGLSQNLLIEQYFVRLLRKHAQDLRTLHQTSMPTFPRWMKLRDFDELYTSVHAQYRSVDEYYYEASCARRLGDISLPTDIVVSEDDPIVCAKALAQWSNNPALRIHRQPHGGHVGFLEHLDLVTSQPNWLEKAVAALVDARLGAALAT